MGRLNQFSMAAGTVGDISGGSLGWLKMYDTNWGWRSSNWKQFRYFLLRRSVNLHFKKGLTKESNQ